MDRGAARACSGLPWLQWTGPVPLCRRRRVPRRLHTHLAAQPHASSAEALPAQQQDRRGQQMELDGRQLRIRSHG